MAASCDQSLREALECPVCKDLFIEPKQLDCGHTYCLNCVNGLEKVPNIVHRIVGDDFFDTIGVGPVSTFVQSVQNNVQCPQCRKMCLVPENGLSTNYAIKDMVDKFRETVQLADDGAPSFLRLGGPKQARKEQHRHCHACAKKVPDSELFICKDCNKPTKKQFICALCVVRSHKQHNVVTLDCLANERDRELAALRIEEILSHAQRMGDEARGMQNEITKQFEMLREKLLAKLSCFYMLQNECLDSEHILLKEHVESKVCVAIQKCEQLNEHFLRLRELKAEFECHLRRWQDELVVDDVPSLISHTNSSPQMTNFFHRNFGFASVNPIAEQQTTSNSVSRKCPFMFIGSPGGGAVENSGPSELLAAAEQMAVNNPSGISKKAPPILVNRRRSRLRAGGVGFASGAGAFGGSPSAGSTSSALAAAHVAASNGGDSTAMDSGASESKQSQERDLFSFFDH